MNKENALVAIRTLRGELHEHFNKTGLYSFTCCEIVETTIEKLLDALEYFIEHGCANY